jgi:PAS domain S-box-containing protein
MLAAEDEQDFAASLHEVLAAPHHTPGFIGLLNALASGEPAYRMKVLLATAADRTLQAEISRTWSLEPEPGTAPFICAAAAHRIEPEDSVEQRVEERTDDLRKAVVYARSLIEASADPLLIVTPQGKISDLNKAAELATGLTRTELIGADFGGFFSDPELAKSAHRRALEYGYARGYELALRHADGRQLPILFNGTIYRDPTGDVAGVCIAARDITEIKQTRAALLRSKQLLDEAGRIALLGGWELDARTRTLSWTDVVYQIHETGPEFQPALDSAMRFVAPEATPLIADAMSRLLKEGRPFELELQIVTARSNRVWIRWVGQPYWERGGISRVGGVIQDITQRKTVEDELKRHRDHLEERVAERTGELATAIENLERSNRELEQFAYVASHDLQEPLRMVASYTQLLAERYAGQLDDRADKYIGYAVDGAQRMQGLINDLLAFSRVGTQGKAFVATDVNEIVAAVMADLALAIRGSGAEIRVGKLPTLPADPTQLRQLFQNLIENAIKFRGENPPRIDISAFRQGPFWIFNVKDKGIGVDPKFQDRIFIIFQRLHERGRYPGSGMGLAIVKKIVERHGRSIRVESASGHGCSFIFSLPCATKGEQSSDG